MSSSDNEKELSRRDFLRRTAAAAAALGAASCMKLGIAEAAEAVAETRQEAGLRSQEMRYRTLGRTGLKVSELGMGTIKIENPVVVHRALDSGINYFDTAECYQGGSSEITLGKGLKGRRDRAIVGTKWHIESRAWYVDTPWVTAKELLVSLDESLKRLGTDHVELIQLHGAQTKKMVESEEVWKAFTEAKKAGKVRFLGLSTHGNIAEVIRAAISSGRYDTVLPVYNAMVGDRVGPIIAEAKLVNLGVITMKALQPAHEGRTMEAFAGMKGNPYQQAIQWVLRDQNVSTVIVDMPTFEEVDEDRAAVDMTMSRAERQEFEHAVRLISVGTCHLCGACTGQCLRGVQVADIMRYRLYHYGYGDRERARELYRALPAGRSAAACTNCEQCRVVCPWGVEVRSRLEGAHGVLA